MLLRDGFVNELQGCGIGLQFPFRSLSSDNQPSFRPDTAQGITHCLCAHYCFPPDPRDGEKKLRGLGWIHHEE